MTVNARFKGPALWLHGRQIPRAILAAAWPLQALTNTQLTNGLQGAQASLPGKPAGDQQLKWQLGRVIQNKDAEGSGKLREKLNLVRDQEQPGVHFMRTRRGGRSGMEGTIKMILGHECGPSRESKGVGVVW